MQIIVIAGFLGSGKTSTLKNMVSMLGYKDPTRLAVIINDFGEIGIDTSVVSTTGIEPVELVSGCVCCQLGVDLIKTIQDIYNRYRPSTVILEPSGVANPGAIKEVLSNLKGIPVERITNLVLVDPIRFELIVDIPVIEEGVAVADILVITKTDLVMDSEIDLLREKLRNLNQRAKIVEISNIHPATLISLIGVLKNEE